MSSIWFSNYTILCDIFHILQVFYEKNIFEPHKNTNYFHCELWPQNCNYLFISLSLCKYKKNDIIINPIQNFLATPLLTRIQEITRDGTQTLASMPRLSDFWLDIPAATRNKSHLTSCGTTFEAKGPVTYVIVTKKVCIFSYSYVNVSQ
jgi:hypothetical protein